MAPGKVSIPIPYTSVVGVRSLEALALETEAYLPANEVITGNGKKLEVGPQRLLALLPERGLVF